MESPISLANALQQLFSHFDEYLPLDAGEKKLLEEKLRLRRIKRRHFLLQEGDVCRHYHFVISGCLKLYQVDTRGKEHNLAFAATNDWITDIGSFHAERASRLYLEAMEPSVVLQMDKADLIFCYENHPKFDRYFRVITENAFVELQNRVLQTISSTAQERYLSFLQRYPELSLRLPNTQIASYLGITPEFLSKLRRDLATQDS